MKRFINSLIAEILGILIVLLFSYTAEPAEIGINIHGLSYHPNHADSTGRAFENLNYGLGVNYLFYKKNRNSLALEGGVFRNSIDDPAAYAALSYHFRIVEGFFAGVGTTAFHSSSVNHGHFLIAPLPIVGYRYRSIAVQMFYAPRIHDLNRNSVFSMYATYFLPLRH